ncbi:MAG: sulfite exporter TauE/SafE family protein [Planctomycetota bacterium]|nr:sulfite exporter TauE/SafE family protein [Planctomycetota bacterium]
MIWIGMAVLGLAIGVVGGVLGIGGGLLVVPALTFLFGFAHKQAVGTSLGMLLPPIGIFAFLNFYKAGHVDIRAAAVLGLTFALGAWAGSYLVTADVLNEGLLRRLFGLMLLYVAGVMLLHSDERALSVARSIGLTAVGLLAFFFLRLIGRRWDGLRPTVVETYHRQREKPIERDFEI